MGSLILLCIFALILILKSKLHAKLSNRTFKFAKKKKKIQQSFDVSTINIILYLKDIITKAQRG